MHHCCEPTLCLHLAAEFSAELRAITRHAKPELDAIVISRWHPGATDTRPNESRIRHAVSAAFAHAKSESAARWRFTKPDSRFSDNAAAFGKAYGASVEPRPFRLPYTGPRLNPNAAPGVCTRRIGWADDRSGLVLARKSKAAALLCLQEAPSIRPRCLRHCRWFNSNRSCNMTDTCIVNSL